MHGGDAHLTTPVVRWAQRACSARARISVAVWIGVVLGLGIWSASAAERVALVMGNSAYTVGALRNPVHDAEDLAAALRRLGFDVILERDVNLRSMREAVCWSERCEIDAPATSLTDATWCELVCCL